jgi:hypothetical protein
MAIVAIAAICSGRRIPFNQCFKSDPPFQVYPDTNPVPDPGFDQKLIKIQLKKLFCF